MASQAAGYDRFSDFIRVVVENAAERILAQEAEAAKKKTIILNDNPDAVLMVADKPMTPEEKARYDALYERVKEEREILKKRKKGKK